MVPDHPNSLFPATRPPKFWLVVLVWKNSAPAQSHQNDTRHHTTLQKKKKKKKKKNPLTDSAGIAPQTPIVSHKKGKKK